MTRETHDPADASSGGDEPRGDGEVSTVDDETPTDRERSQPEDAAGGESAPADAEAAVGDPETAVADAETAALDADAAATDSAYAAGGEDAAADAGGSGNAPPATDYGADRGPVRTLDTRVRLKWAGQVVLGTAVLGAIGGGLAVAFEPVEAWMVLAVTIPLLVLGLGWVWLRYRLWAFQFRTDHLFLERGVYRNVETVVPYVRIQHVDTSRGPVERVLGLSTLVVYTAGSRGADVAIPGLPAAEAESMQDRVKELAVAAEGGEGL